MLGRSVEDRAIRAERIGDPESERKVLVVGSVHGDEPAGHAVIARLHERYAERLGSVDLWLVRAVNPDGLAAGTRGNAHGVDLNRNFGFDFDPNLDGGYESGPHAFSEPESRAVRELARRVRFDLSIWYHQPWGATLVPCDERGAVARRYARIAHHDARRDCDGYYPGSAVGWLDHAFGTTAFVVEFSARPPGAKEVRRHARAVATLARDPRGG